MTLVEVLEEKKTQIIQKANPHLIEFSADDIKILSDVTQLRFFKLANSQPGEFQRSSDIWACCQAVSESGDLYRVLEFCVLKNKILEKSVWQVFEFLKR